MQSQARSLSCFAASLLVATAARGQSLTLAGIVRDSVDRLPVPGVRIALGSWLGGWTDTAGRFSFPIPPGRYRPKLSCPRLEQPDLTVVSLDLTIAGAPHPLDLALPGGRSCLAALESVEYGEFDGVMKGDGDAPTIQLCLGPAHRVAIQIPPVELRGLGKKLGGRNDPKRTALTLRVRGRLNGPGFFGRDGSAGYLLEVARIRSARMAAPASACRNQ